MIQERREQELPILADIWLEANKEAHSFIPNSYWEGHFDAVKAQLAQAELYVWRDKQEPRGFIGMDGAYIAGLFVRQEARSRGIGRALLNFVKGRKNRLELCVYEKNARAVQFYQREGFTVQRRQRDPNTGETEYVMIWNG